MIIQLMVVFYTFQHSPIADLTTFMTPPHNNIQGKIQSLLILMITSQVEELLYKQEVNTTIYLLTMILLLI